MPAAMVSGEGSPAWLINSLMRSPGSPSDETWHSLADTLRRLRLDGVTVLLLEAGGPLALLSAQLLYASGPFLGFRAQQLARLLESDGETKAFAEYLRGGQQKAAHENRGVP